MALFRRNAAVFACEILTRLSFGFQEKTTRIKQQELAQQNQQPETGGTSAMQRAVAATARTPAPNVIQNVVLATLPRADFELIRPLLVPVDLKRNAILHDTNRPVEAVHFIEGGVLSRVAEPNWTVRSKSQWSDALDLSVSRSCLEP